MTTYANPGAVADAVADSQFIEASWGNAIRDRVINNYATAAARDAAIPSPVVGQMCAIDNDAAATLALQQYVGATDKWQAPWNLPWGYVTSATLTTPNQTGIAAVVDIAGLTVTATAVANRRWHVYLSSMFSISQVTTTGVTSLAINTGASGAGTILCQSQTTIVAAAQGCVGEVGIAVTTTAGSLSYHVRGGTSAGTATINTGATTPWVLTIEDLGPAGPPA